MLATVVRLLETTFIRVGNDEYARENESFGLTTMRGRHVRIDGAKLLFRFHGKSGQEHSIELTDRRLAHIVQQCRDLPGYELFHYVDRNGEICAIDSGDVNRYIREAIRAGFHSERFSHLGRHRAGSARAACRRAIHERDGRQTNHCRGGEKRGRGVWETGRRHAGSITFIRRSSTPTRTALCSR